jgi:hypothetical protein
LVHLSVHFLWTFDLAEGDNSSSIQNENSGARDIAPPIERSRTTRKEAPESKQTAAGDSTRCSDSAVQQKRRGSKTQHEVKEKRRQDQYFPSTHRRRAEAKLHRVITF